jgi:predicted RNA-binding protein (virulence factor B family)
MKRKLTRSKFKDAPVHLPVYTFIKTVSSTRINNGNLQISTLYKDTHFCGNLMKFGIQKQLQVSQLNLDYMHNYHWIKTGDL